MLFTKKQFIFLIIVIGIALFVSMYKMPYYIYKPGGADALNPIVEVEGGYKSQGDMHLVTIQGGQATPVQYLWAKVLPHQQVLPLRKVRPEGVSKDEFLHVQLQMMESSQEKAKVVAYQAADKDIDIDYKGVYVVSVVDEMPASDVLQRGDRITGIDDTTIQKADELISYVEKKQAGDTIEVDIKRDDQTLTKDIKLKPFPDDKNKTGIGIRLATDRAVQVDPDVQFSSGDIGGPSAGLMFSLEIYDQLTKTDVTNGFQVAGTGEIDYQGNILRIGGVKKKVIAADDEGCAIFFAPNENGANDSNYEAAMEAADDIGTDMTIVPVDTFSDALNYLQQLQAKEK
ncbi:protease DdcP [Lentibacillus halophilus]|uniref:endopeptidase La n=1 Tax=Lentibacillus halophilus TaxID=295065 RepID=A0ABN0ZFE9_9BACI